MSAPPSGTLAPASTETDDGLGLLAELFALEPSAEASPRRPAGRHRAPLRVRLRRSVQRAAAWGAGPGGAWRAW